MGEFKTESGQEGSADISQGNGNRESVEAKKPKKQKTKNLIGCS